MPKSLAMEILSALASAHRASSHRHENSDDAERDFDVGDFELIDVAGPFEVEVETGAAPSVRASGPQWALDNLRVEQDGDRLVIGSDGESEDVSILVTVRSLRAVRS